MYELAARIGEDSVNQALRAFLAAHAFKGPPSPTSLDLIAEIRNVTPPDHQSLIDDLFEHVTMYDSRAISADAKRLDEGHYALVFKTQLKKRVLDARGEETPVRPSDWVEVAVFDASGKNLFLQSMHATADVSEFRIDVAGRPARAWIDPYDRLLNRRREPNSVSVVVH